MERVNEGKTQRRVRASKHATGVCIFQAFAHRSTEINDKVKDLGFYFSRVLTWGMSLSQNEEPPT